MIVSAEIAKRFDRFQNLDELRKWNKFLLRTKKKKNSEEMFLTSS